MNENITHTTIERYINEHGRLVYSNVGVSMLPLLRQGRDTFVLEKKSGRCKKYDVVLFKKGNSYVLHRIVKITDNGYMIRGDNCIAAEYIPESLVIAVMTECVRDGKRCDLNSAAYKFYSRAWNGLYPIRRGFMIIRDRLKNNKKSQP